MKTETRTVFKSRIARILLNSPDGDLSKYRVAKLAGCTYPWAHALLKKMGDGGLVDGTRVLDFGALFSWWVRWQPPYAHRDYMIRDPLTTLHGAGMQYALTTYRAENTIQNYLFPSRTDLYVKHKEMVAWHKVLARDGLVGRGNVRILYGDDHVFYKSSHTSGLTIASVPQIISDLYAEGGPCEEAADMLTEKVKDGALREL